jgi:hypothetical protein
MLLRPAAGVLRRCYCAPAAGARAPSGAAAGAARRAVAARMVQPRGFASGAASGKKEAEPEPAAEAWGWRKSFDTAVNYARSSRDKG